MSTPDPDQARLIAYTYLVGGYARRYTVTLIHRDAHLPVVHR